MKTVKAKTILQNMKYGNQWFGSDYNMNLYRGCCHGCIYCDSRSNCYRIDNFDEVTVKENALAILDRELAYRKKGVVGLGAMSDHYNPFEKDLEITRGALKLIEQNGYGLSLETKSATITRDIDLFKKIQAKHNVILKLTITCTDDQLCKKIEPNVSIASERFKAVKQLSDAGLFVGILFTPWLPFITDTEENVRTLVKQAHEAGAHFIYASTGVTLRENQMEYYFQQLDKLFPGLSDKYRQVYRGRYACNTLNKNLYKIFEQECKRYGMLYKMQDIINAYKKPRGIVQESLF
ncbi:radical SAM protein [Breznakia sp. OttesenSCG-928-G09]|nr:radical SAM protein [Breznakia sp. OttesenSCG-928-G09]